MHEKLAVLGCIYMVDNRVMRAWHFFVESFHRIVPKSVVGRRLLFREIRFQDFSVKQRDQAKKFLLSCLSFSTKTSEGTLWYGSFSKIWNFWSKKRVTSILPNIRPIATRPQ